MPSLPGSSGSHERGFTLIELLLSAAIIAIVTTIIMIRFANFDSTVLLKSLAYEVGISIREAQVYSVSVVDNQGSFDEPYGMSFSDNATEYFFFTGEPTEEYPEFSSDRIINRFSIGRSMRIADVCVVVNGSENCIPSRLDVSFRRPDHDALFNTDNGFDSEVTSGIVRLTGSSGEQVWRVTVNTTGQISVSRE